MNALLFKLQTNNMNTTNILIVDDYLDNRLLLGQIAEILLCTYAYAHNGKEAIDMLVSDTVFDIIFMDIEMPVMNGIETTSTIKNMPPPLNRIPVIAITAHYPDNFTKKFSNAGFNDFIGKPYTIEKIKEVIDKYKTHQYLIS